MFWTANIFELWPQNCLSGSFVILSCASCWCRSKVLIDRQVGKLERFFIMEWLSVFQRFWHCFVRNYYRLTTRLSVKSFFHGPAQARELPTQVYFTSLQQFVRTITWVEKKPSYDTAGLFDKFQANAIWTPTILLLVVYWIIKSSSLSHKKMLDQ